MLLRIYTRHVQIYGSPRHVSNRVNFDRLARDVPDGPIPFVWDENSDESLAY